ncbi:MAG TPA: hydroxymethylglutaryl-CoA reductase, degradative [Candidatus Diapherotrites archaeon]|uniref:3-hydroxy-3-methylglutaryl coenzyme A reductase n=1 Tax=Candidatus Iainarchaeum sp. TaxID=3101447 RepID=A0A7J4JGM2_9ARCH|nr:hydroxymethylglutaryl-CoA reductase, degradative [Candidatus Diapherotrites archaeon]HIH16280.1 hydroxymethylglutaryl-CoA reductase, degradative [Candidatus Diapherotrites archaeon]
MAKSSALQGFYKKSQDERLEEIAAVAGLSPEETALLKQTGCLAFSLADKMIENVYGVMPLPLGLATNFQVNGRDYLVPMALEEPSVVAAASYAAKLARASGGFTASSTGPLMIAQIQVVQVKDLAKAKKAVEDQKEELVNDANQVFPGLKQFGGGAMDLEARVIDTVRGKQLIVHLIVDVRDAMGANSINTMAEGIAPKIEELTGGKVRLRIISNLAIFRLFRAEAVWTKEVLAESVKELGLKGAEVVEAVLDAWAFAAADPFRGTTHNKGIMNGIDAVTVATGNDFRAVEAGAHSYAAYNRKYTTLTSYEKTREGHLKGKIELPLAVGLVGGATKTHPIAKINVKLLGVKTAHELGEVMASVGLAQNFAAIRALATEGIQRGHMKLHAKNIAVLGGAANKLIDRVADAMVKEKNITVDRAKQLVEAFS